MRSLGGVNLRPPKAKLGISAVAAIALGVLSNYFETFLGALVDGYIWYDDFDNRWE